MSRITSADRETAARALCRLYGNSEEAIFDGEPMWRSFLMDVDVVLQSLNIRIAGVRSNRSASVS